MGHKYTKILPINDSPQDAALYLGSIDYILEDSLLDQFGIAAILSVLPTRPPRIENVLSKHKIPPEDYRVYPLEDSPEEYISIFGASDIRTACHFIHAKRKEGKSVLVHCDAGITRSPAVIIAYLMKYGKELGHPTGASLQESIELVRQLHDRIDVCMFHDELVELEELLRESEAGDDEGFNLTTPLRTPTSTISTHTKTPTSTIKQSPTLQWMRNSSISATDRQFSLAEPAETAEDAVDRGNELLHKTWQGICRYAGGPEAFAVKFYENLKQRGGARIESILGGFDPIRVGKMMLALVHEIILFGLSFFPPTKMAFIIDVHKHLNLGQTDFDNFRKAMVSSIAEEIKSEDSEEVQKEWDNLLICFFGLWLAHLPPPAAPKPASTMTQETPILKLPQFVKKKKVGLPPTAPQ